MNKSFPGEGPRNSDSRAVDFNAPSKFKWQITTECPRCGRLSGFEARDLSPPIVHRLSTVTDPLPAAEQDVVCTVCVVCRAQVFIPLCYIPAAIQTQRRLVGRFSNCGGCVVS